MNFPCMRGIIFCSGCYFRVFWDVRALRGCGIIKSSEVIIRTMTAHKLDGTVLRARPILTRPSEKSALGIMSCLRISDWCIDLSLLGCSLLRVLRVSTVSVL